VFCGLKPGACSSSPIRTGQLEDNLLERSFVGLNPGIPICWSTTFAPCRHRLLYEGWADSQH
jgi:hypothetical protein